MTTSIVRIPAVRSRRNIVALNRYCGGIRWNWRGIYGIIANICVLQFANLPIFRKFLTFQELFGDQKDWGSRGREFKSRHSDQLKS